MKKIIVVLLLSAFFIGKINAQYSKSAGLRFGTFSGITVKHFIGGGNAIEGLLTWYYHDGFVLTGLYEFHKPFPSVDNLYWYLGGGLHIGQGRFDSNKYTDNYFVFGGDAVIGLEYCFQQVPFNIGLDWKPAINFIGPALWWDGLGISFRYMF